MTNKNYEFPGLDGALNPSTPEGIVTGNSGAEAEKTAKHDTSENGKSPKDSILPKWLGTDPAILGSQLHDILALMQRAGWFVYTMPVTAANGRTAVRITISPPLPNTIGIDGPVSDRVISINGKPVTDE